MTSVVGAVGGAAVRTVALRAFVWTVAGLLLAVAAASAFAVIQYQVAERRQSDLALVQGKLDIALNANQISTDTIKRLEAERDGYLLKRAAEKAEADRLVAMSHATAKRVHKELQAAKRRIAALSLSANCYAVMQAPICPEIADELRATP